MRTTEETDNEFINNKLGGNLNLNSKKDVIFIILMLIFIVISFWYILGRVNINYIVVKTIDSIEVVRDHKVDTMYLINNKYSSYENNDNVGDTLWIEK